MSLYQEIRPNNLNQIVGNDKVVGALRQQIKKLPKDRFHAIMFSGQMGCGKTTLAKIIVNEYNCSENDIFEINAANLRGIDTVREVCDRMYLVPFGGSSKVYIFDEVQQATKDAQSALLKMVEDCPEHCYFIFCTTNPESVLGPLKNRCAEFEVKKLSSKKILEILRNVCEEKKLNIHEDVLAIIATNCEGCPRTAIILLEKVIGIEDVDEAIALIVSDIEANSTIIELCKMLVMFPEKRKKEWQRVLKTFEKLDETDSEKIRFYILAYLKNFLLKIESNDFESANDIVKLMNTFSYSTFYGKKNFLASLVVRACLGD